MLGFLYLSIVIVASSLVIALVETFFCKPEIDEKEFWMWINKKDNK